jgi:hypothetical protein
MFIRALKRIERIVTEINAWLLAVAIGLATLDATVFVALKTPSLVSPCRDCTDVADGGEIFSKDPLPTAGAPMIMWQD